MGIRESLTLTWQDLDQSPLSLFTYCEEAMATKPNTNLSTARLWNANTQATYHRMMEKMQALYYHLQRFTQCLLNRGGSEYCPLLLVRFMLLYTAPDVKRQLIEHRQHLAENSCAQRKLVILFYQIMSTDNAQINEKTLPQITVRLLFATSSRFAFYQYNHKSSALCVDFSVFSRQSCVPSTRTCCLTVFSKPLFSYVACTYQVYLQAGHNVQK